jgi:hypothetical protein
MPVYTDVPLSYQPWTGHQPVFRRGRDSFRVTDFNQNGAADCSNRQAHFEDQLRRISIATGSSVIPFYINWNQNIIMRLDRGCVGHSVRRGFITSFLEDEQRFVSHVELRNQ